MHYKLPLVFEPQPEGGYTVTSSAITEFPPEGHSVADALENARDAFAAVLEIYRDEGRALPAGLCVDEPAESVRMDLPVAAP